MSEFKIIDDLDVAGKVVLVRGDLNVPMQDGKVSDTTRIDRLAPTLVELAKKGAKVVVCSHFGRPKNGPDEKNSLRQLLPELSKAVGQEVAFATDCINEPAASAVAALAAGKILLLENTRFYKEEEKNDPEFAKKLASIADLYVNDAFSSAHRAHASTEGVTKFLPSAAGRLMEAELTALTKALEKPTRPTWAVVGGAKISTKLDLLGNLVAKVDKLVLGGGMAYTFLFAKGIDVGGSLCEKEMADQARAIAEKAEKAGCEIIIPTDFVVTKEFKANAASRVAPADGIAADEMGLDIGPATVASIKAKLVEAKTLVWNGPMGAFELEPFDAGTNALAQAVAELTVAGKLLSVAGGGDTVSALAKAGVEDKFSYISTAGGAFLEWLEGKDLPGVAALKK